MKRKRNLTAEERAAIEAFDRESSERLEKLRELVNRGWSDLNAAQPPRERS